MADGAGRGAGGRGGGAASGSAGEQLIRDVELAALCGLPPYVDEMVDLFVDDDVIYTGVPRLFTRPLRLTAREAFSLLAAGRAALELPGADASGPLARALDKVAAALGGAPVLRVDVPPAPFLDAVPRGGRPAGGAWPSPTSWPTGASGPSASVDPLAVVGDRGHWYLQAVDTRWARSAGSASTASRRSPRPASR